MSVFYLEPRGRVERQIAGPMRTTSPITVAIGHFDDLLALGLQTLLADDPHITVVRGWSAVDP